MQTYFRSLGNQKRLEPQRLQKPLDADSDDANQRRSWSVSTTNSLLATAVAATKCPLVFLHWLQWQ